jgi:YtxH-like protein
MNLKKRQSFFSVLLDTGLHLLDSLRERLPDEADDIRGRVSETYDTASRRVSRVTAALRGEENSHIFGKAVALLIGVGVGVGIGVLIAPATGEETRAEINHKISEFGDQGRQHAAKKQQAATETQGE